MTLAAAGVALAATLIGTLIVRGGASDAASAQGPGATDALPASAQALPPPEPSATASSAPAATAALRVEDLPTTSGSAAPAAKRKSAPTAAPVKRNCSPPYELDSSGNKRWKRECL
jgi:hypothetical protein